MDATAIAFCRDNKIPIVVFDMSTTGQPARASSKASTSARIIR